MEQNWVMYPMEDEHGVGLVGINIALSGAAPDPRRPACTRVRIAFKKPGEDGLGDSKERDRIGAMEDTLAQRLENSFGAVHVASVRGDGAVVFWAYSKAHMDKAIRDAATEVFEGYAIECSTRPDPKWETYWELLPDTDTLREVADMHLVALLENEGDDLVTPRPVEHFVVFTTKKSAERFMKAAGQQEFETRQQEGEDGSILVVATREDPVDLETIHEVTSTLVRLAEAEQGEYDGWETRVVAKGAPPASP